MDLSQVFEMVAGVLVGYGFEYPLRERKLGMNFIRSNPDPDPACLMLDPQL